MGRRTKHFTAEEKAEAARGYRVKYVKSHQ
jgi:hypothetical protein